MKKNTLIRIFSVLMIFAVVLSTVACTGDNSTKDGEVGSLNVDNLKPENGTIIYEGTKVNNEGETEKVSQVIDVEHVDVPYIQPEEFIEDEKDKESFIKQEGPNDYGMSEDEVKDVIENKENWKSFHVFKLIENKTDKIMVCNSVVAKGGDGIYIRKTLDAEYGIGPGNCSSIAIYATVDTNKYKTDEEIEAAFNELDIEIQYALTDDIYGEIDNWDEVTTQVVKL